MKILHTADWHIGSYKGPEKDGVNLRGSDIVRCLNFMVEKAVNEKPDVIIVSGDIFNQAKVWSDRVLPEMVTAISIITNLSEIAPVFVMRGTPNHDGDGQFKLLMDIFKDNPAVTVACEPTVKVIETADGKINIAALPGFDRGVFRAKFPGLSKEEENIVFTNELSNMVMGLRAMCDNSYPSILLAHYTVSGANMESGQTAFFAQSDPVLTPESLDAAKFDLVALGHIHRPQRVESAESPVYYSGAINALNFNDEGQTRGFWIHELGKQSDFIETPIRYFQTIHMCADDISSFNAGDTGSVAEKLWRGKIDDCIVRVLYSCTEEDNKALNRDMLTKALMLDGAFYVAGIIPESVVSTASKDVLSESGSPEELLKEYLKDKHISDDKIKLIITEAHPIIEQVVSNNAAASLKGTDTIIPSSFLIVFLISCATFSPESHSDKFPVISSHDSSRPNGSMRLVYLS